MDEVATAPAQVQAYAVVVVLCCSVLWQHVMCISAMYLLRYLHVLLEIHAEDLTRSKYINTRPASLRVLTPQHHVLYRTASPSTHTTTQRALQDSQS